MDWMIESVVEAVLKEKLEEIENLKLEVERLKEELEKAQNS